MQACRAEWIVHRRDGPRLWTRLRLQPVAERGGCLQIVANLEDITEYKQARESVRVSEARLDVAMEASELSMWDWDVALRPGVLQRSMAQLRSVSIRGNC